MANPYPPGTYHWKLYESMNDIAPGVALELSGQSLGQFAIISNGTAVLIGGSNVTLSQSSNSITFIAGGGGTGGQAFTAGISSGGNTSGTTGLATGQIVFVGGNNITLSQSIDAFNGSATITISAASQSSQTLQTQNMVSINESTGHISLIAGNNITLSQNASSITISGPNTQTQSVQTQNLVSINESIGHISFVGGNNITLSQNASTITISAFNQSVQPQSVQTQNLIDLSLSGNTSGALALVSSGTVILAGGNNITLSQNGQSITISGANAGVGGFSAAGISGGNTSGDTGMVSQQVVFAGGNNVTLSGSTSGGSMTITISGASAGAGAGFTAGMSNLGNTSGTTGQASSRLLFAGGNNITLSQSLDAGNGSGTITISAANQTQESQTVGISNLGNTAGTTGIASGNNIQLILAGGNNITLSQSLNGSSATVTISGLNTVAQTNQTLGIFASSQTVGQSSSSTIDARSVTYVGQGIVSVGLSGGSVLFSATTAAQTVESQSIGMSNIGNTSGTTGVASGGQVRFVLAGGNNITLSQSLNGASGTVTISAFNQSVQPAGSDTHGISNLGNTSGTSGVISGSNLQFILVGGNNITLSQSINGSSATITISAPNLSGGAGLNAGISTQGNTLGTTGLVASSLLLVGGNNVTLSQSVNGQSATLTISAGAGGGAFSAGMSTQGNTSGTTGIVGSQLVMVGGNNITLSQSVDAGNSSVTITISGAASAQAPVISHWMNIPPAGETATGMLAFGTSNGTMLLFPLHDPSDVFPGNMTVNTMMFNMSGSDTSNSQAHTYSLSIGIYTLQDASNLALAFSGLSSWTMSANASNSSSYNGLRWLSVHSSIFNVAPTFSNTSYWMGVWMQSSGRSYSISSVGVRWLLTNARSGFMVTASAANKSLLNYPFYGIYSASFTTAMPGTINRSDISGNNALNIMPHVVFNNLVGIYG